MPPTAAAFADLEAVAALSPMQQGLLFHSLLDPLAGVYVNQHVIALRGDLDVVAFRRAWQEVADRHQVFRSSFHWDDVDQPMMAIWKRASIDVRIEDWRQDDAPAQEARLREFIARDKQRGFALDFSPLVRFGLFRRNDDQWWFYWANHHLVLDGWSAALAAREAFTAYGAYREGRRPALPATALFTDYLRWLHDQDAAKAEAFWRETLNGVRGPSTIPGDAASLDESGAAATEEIGTSPRFFQTSLHVSAEETQRLKGFARTLGTTVSVVVQTAWAILLATYTREPDVLFGITSSGRPPELPGVEAMVGLFISTLPIRLHVSRHETIRGLVRHMHDANVRLRDVEYSALGSVQAWSGLPSGTSLFQSLLVFENYPVDQSLVDGTAGLAVEGIDVIEATNYPLTLTIGPGERLLLQATFDASQFTEAYASRLLRQFRVAIRETIEDTERAVRDISLLDEAERRTLLAEWRGEPRSFPLDRPLHHWIEEQAERTPGATAVRFRDRELTYGELNARATDLATVTLDAGVTHGALVGVVMDRSIEMVVSLLAVLKAGCAYVPLDPEYPAERLAFQLADADVPLVLAQRRFATLLSGTAARVVVVDDALPDTPGNAVRGRQWPRVGPEHPAYVIYTSGSTGRPKGVVNTHRGICNRLFWMQEAFGLGTDDRVLQKTPYSFDVSVWEFFWPLMTGATLVIAEPGGHRDAAYIADVIARERITVVHFVPAMLDALLEEPAFDRCVSLRDVICSGEALSWSSTRRFHRRSRARLHNLYGPTEAAVDVTWWPCLPEDTTGSVPIGRPISNIDIHLLDDDLQMVPIGVPGELCIAGVGLAQGYWRRPALTADRFVPHPLSENPGERVYRTGDLARRRADGVVEYLGRLDDQIKIRGFRIELGEIESVLLAHPIVRQAVVVMRREQEASRLLAYIVPAERDDSRRADADSALLAHAAASICVRMPSSVAGSLREHLAARLPAYMLPDDYLQVAELPLTHSGKVDRRALPSIPFKDERSSARERVSPRDALERALLACWTDVLPARGIGVTDTFADAGGDSLLATRLLSRIRSRLAVDMPLRALFEAPTIERLARLIGERRLENSAGTPQSDSPNAAVVEPRPTLTGGVRLSPSQHYLFGLVGGDYHHYNLAQMFDVRTSLTRTQLEQLTLALALRHDALCLRFQSHDGEWSATLGDPAQAGVVDDVDLTGLEDEARAKAVSTLCAQAQRGLDLARGPLFRLLHVRLGKDRPSKLLAVVHHLAADGASLWQLHEDLQHAGRQLATGQRIALPAPTGSWQAWTTRLAREASCDVNQAAASWLDADVSGLRTLPSDLDEGPNIQSSERAVTVRLSRTATARLLDLARRDAIDLGHFVLAAVARAVNAWCESSSTLIDWIGHGRDPFFDGLDVSQSVGYFSTRTPLLLQNDSGSSLAKLASTSHERLHMLPLGSLTYGLVRYLHHDDRLRQRLAALPRPQVSVNYLGRVDFPATDDALLIPTHDPVGELRAPVQQRACAVRVVAFVRAGELEVAFNYSAHRHRASTIGALSSNVSRELLTVCGAA